MCTNETIMIKKITFIDKKTIRNGTDRISKSGSFKINENWAKVNATNYLSNNKYNPYLLNLFFIRSSVKLVVASTHEMCRTSTLCIDIVRRIKYSSRIPSFRPLILLYNFLGEWIATLNGYDRMK